MEKKAKLVLELNKMLISGVKRKINYYVFKDCWPIFLSNWAPETLSVLVQVVVDPFWVPVSNSWKNAKI